VPRSVCAAGVVTNWTIVLGAEMNNAVLTAAY